VVLVKMFIKNLLDSAGAPLVKILLKVDTHGLTPVVLSAVADRRRRCQSEC
jgi:hypothetical protein